MSPLKKKIYKFTRNKLKYSFCKCDNCEAWNHYCSAYNRNRTRVHRKINICSKCKYNIVVYCKYQTICRSSHYINYTKKIHCVPMLVKKSKPYQAGRFVRFLRAYSDKSEAISPCNDCYITWTCGEDRLKFCRKVNKHSLDIIYLPKAGNERNENYLDL